MPDPTDTAQVFAERPSDDAPTTVAASTDDEQLAAALSRVLRVNPASRAELLAELGDDQRGATG